MTSNCEVGATVHPHRRVPAGPTLREVLVSRAGIAPMDVNWFVHRRVFPLRARLARNCRLLCGADPFDAESALVRELVQARSVGDVDAALQSYRWHPSQGARAFAWLLGTRVDRRKVIQFFSAAMDGSGLAAQWRRQSAD